MSNINEFISYISQYTDVARPERFKVIINVPALITGTTFASITNLAAFKNLSFQCKEVDLPTRMLDTFNARTYGNYIKYPYQSSYDDAILSFLCVSNLAGTTQTGLPEKRLFDDWLEFINPYNPNATVRNNFKYKEEYVADVSIYHYDTVGFDQFGLSPNPTYVVKLRNAWPTTVASIPLAWSKRDEIMQLQVTLSYEYWTREDLLSQQITPIIFNANSAPTI